MACSNVTSFISRVIEKEVLSSFGFDVLSFKIESGPRYLLLQLSIRPIVTRLESSFCDIFA